MGVQAANCAPLWARFNGAEGEVKEGQTAAEGIRIAHPVRAEAILAAVRKSGGSIIAVEEHEIMDGMEELARLGILVEASSAVVIPALARIEHILLPDSNVVLSLTGSGYKAPQLASVAREVLSTR